MGLASKRSKRDEESSGGEDDYVDDDGSEGGIDMAEEGEEGGSDSEPNNNANDAEMEEIEREYREIREEEEDIMKNLIQHKDGDVLKGQALKNQKEPLRSSLCESDDAVCQAYSDLITSSKQMLNSLLELEGALLEKNPFAADEAHNDAAEENDEEWSRMHDMHCRITPFRNSAIDKWRNRTQVNTGAAAFRGKLHAFNQSISDQVSNHMRDPSRMIKRMQLRRSSVGIIGEVSEEASTKKDEDATGDGDPELLDDSEFYQQLLKEFLESCDHTSSERAFYALKKLQPKKRKIVDRRASKSRKIRYNVHEKIVNFMAPLPMNLPPIAPKLFENVFGLKKQEAAAVL
ncbi:hypothetical protein QJS04_geneDACA018416 [Acorus gramineus]|uniref:Protein AATF n=1 Tax=Acorus gramineus TaxID=55184 RepID=A0AAV9AEK6_ACOGR|nr:hypothetical protein QJS04_geneDACA018416 [Acorus gramineus]